MKSKLALMMAVVCGSLSAGSIEVIATGEAEGKPDYFVMYVHLNSFCYDTPNESQAANERHIAQVMALFDQHKGTDKDRVVLESHHSLKKNEYTEPAKYTGLICEQKWRSTAKLKIHHQAIDKAYGLKMALVDFAGQVGKPDPAKPQQSYAQIYDPGFAQFATNLNATQAAADKMAWDDAMKRFLNLKGRCGIKNAKLLSATPKYESRPVGVPVEWVKGTDGGPLHYENYVQKATWTVKWEVDAAPTCSN